MKRTKLILLLVLLISNFTSTAFSYNIVVENDDGVKIYYSFNGNTELYVTNGGQYKGTVVIPKIVISNGKTYTVTGIGDNAFKGCSYLTSVTIPNSVTTIGTNAFSACGKLDSIFIPSSVTLIDVWAFRNCTGLTSIYIPNSVKTIGSEAFYGCVGLESIYFEEGSQLTSIGGGAFKGCSNANLTSITIPNSVKNIENAVFHGCSNIKIIILGQGIDEISYAAFEGLTQLENVFCYATRYPIAYDTTFKDSRVDYAVLHVPSRGINQYKAHEVWGKFMDVVPLTDEEEEMNPTPILSIIQADQGSVDIQTTFGSFYPVTINANDGWKIHSVTFNDEDVTSQLSGDNKYTTPAIKSNSKLTVVYEQVETNMNNVKGSSPMRIQATSYGVRVSDAPANETIRVYSADGILCKTVKAVGQTTDIPLDKDKIYIIKAGDKTMKLGL